MFSNLNAGLGGPGLERLRVHQWAKKNALVFVPILRSHRFDFGSMAQAAVAAIAFSLAASTIYILNDLVDLDADRGHRSKRLRPLAAGVVSVWQAMLVAPVLLRWRLGDRTARFGEPSWRCSLDISR